MWDKLQLYFWFQASTVIPLAWILRLLMRQQSIRSWSKWAVSIIFSSIAIFATLLKPNNSGIPHLIVIHSSSVTVLPLLLLAPSAVDHGHGEDHRPEPHSLSFYRSISGIVSSVLNPLDEFSSANGFLLINFIHWRCFQWISSLRFPPMELFPLSNGLLI